MNFNLSNYVNCNSVIVFQNTVVMSVGLAALGICVGYIAYMRSKYENLGYYAAVDKEGGETFVRKQSKWE